MASFQFTGDYTNVWTSDSTATTAGGGWISGYQGDMRVAEYVSPAMPIEANVMGEYMEVITEPSYKKRKRITLFGRHIEIPGAAGTERSLMALQWIKGAKKKLSKKEQKALEKRAEKAFQEAVKSMELGMTDVAKKFEHEMEVALGQASIPSGYDTFITNKEIELFRKHLPKDKELVIDEIDEYDRPLPTKIQRSLKKAKDTGTFEKFVIFWVRRVPDPILFGVVKGQKRFYFIDEWDDDVSIEDFLEYKDKEL